MWISKESLPENEPENEIHIWLNNVQFLEYFLKKIIFC